MDMKKPFFLPLILILAFLPFASGLEVIVNSYDYGANTNVNTYMIQAVHPGSGTADSAWGESFRTYFDDVNLTVLQLWFYQTAATGGLTAYIYAETGTFGSSSLPTGSALATSSEVTVTAGAFTVYNFTFASGYILDAAVDYCFYVAGTSGDVNAEYIAVDASAPVSVNPAVGNAFYYDNSAWTAVSGSDVCFILYGNDGTAVSFNLGGDVTINEITETTNVTAEITATNNFNNTAVSAGDVTANGAVTVSGAVTNNFNNTAVTASGDITAGAVTAGDVTASGAVTMAGDLSVNGTFENATLTYLTSTAVSGDANVYFLIAFIGLAVLLTFYNKVPLLNFLVGVVGISFIMLTIAKTDLPFWPYSSVLLALTSLICMISGGFKMRDN